MPLFFGPGNNSFARCIKNCSINKIIHNQGGGDPAQNISTTGNPTITYPGNNYIVYTFTEPYGTFSSNVDLSVNVVVVGGGGGGGGGYVAGSGGGGGGGGEIKNESYHIIPNNIYTSIVGSGGIGGAGGPHITPTDGSNGDISLFGGGISAIGGYGGTGQASQSQQPGGSGGGSSDASGGVGWYSSYNEEHSSAGTLYEGHIPQNGPIIINTSMYYFGGGGGGGTSGNDPYNNNPVTPANSTNKSYGVGYGGGAVACGDANNNGIINTGGGGSGGGVFAGSSNNGGNGGSGIIIIYFHYSQQSTTSYDITCPPYKCPETINKKSLNTNADVDQTLTQSSRAVNAIRYAPGGKTQYGYSATIYQNSQVTYLGRVEGQPGGIGRLSARNRF